MNYRITINVDFLIINGIFTNSLILPHNIENTVINLLKELLSKHIAGKTD